MITNLKRGIPYIKKGMPYLLTGALLSFASSSWAATPVAVAETHPQLVSIGLNVELDGSSSSDADSLSGNDDIVDFDWFINLNKVDDDSVDRDEVETVSTLGLLPGIHSVRLEVEDATGAVEINTINLEITSAPPPAFYSLSANWQFQIHALLCTSQTTNSIGIANNRLNTTDTRWHQRHAAGDLTLEERDSLLTWTSGLRNFLNSNHSAYRSSIGFGCSPVSFSGPAAVISAPLDGAEFGIGSSINFDGSASSDPDSSAGTNDDIVEFDWFIEDSNAVITQVDDNSADRDETELFTGTLATGMYTLTLTVTDRTGRTSSATINFEVSTAPPPSLGGIPANWLIQVDRLLCHAQNRAAAGKINIALKRIDTVKKRFNFFYSPKAFITLAERDELLAWADSLKVYLQADPQGFANDSNFGC